MKQTNDTNLTARVRCFGGILAAHRFTVAVDGTVRVYDSIAGHYTRCHGMTPRTESRIRNLAARA